MMLGPTVELMLFDASGHVVVSRSTDFTTAVKLQELINGRSLAAGVYLAKVIVEGQLIFKKFVIQ